MNKSELISRVASKAGISKMGATVAVETAVDDIGAALKKGERVHITGFGTLRRVDKTSSPQTGEAIKIASRKAVKFTPGERRILLEGRFATPYDTAKKLRVPSSRADALVNLVERLKNRNIRRERKQEPVHVLIARRKRGGAHGLFTATKRKGRWSRAAKR